MHSKQILTKQAILSLPMTALPDFSMTVCIGSLFTAGFLQREVVIEWKRVSPEHCCFLPVRLAYKLSQVCLCGSVSVCNPWDL